MRVLPKNKGPDEKKSFKCKDCGAMVTEADVEDFETAKQFGFCRRCYHNPDKWGNE